jgi:hypothetical protein
VASPKATRNAHRTTPDPATITQIKGYPSKLIIYLCPASSYWQIRYFSGGTYHKKSSRTSVKQEAIEAAKQFYDDINYKQRFNPSNKHELFEVQAVEWFQLEQARCTRGQITQPFFNTLVKRFNKHVSPYFSGKLVKDITFVQLELFLAVLAREGLKADTQKGYLNIVFSVLKHAYENGLLAKLPKRPKLHIEDNPSDYFNADEMKLLIATAKSMAGKSVRIEQGKANKHGTRPKRMVHIMPDFWRLIEFMFYSFIRPHDVRVLQHKHVEVKTNEHTYLKLTHPPTKKHSKPVATMAEAVPLYMEQLDYQRSRGYGKDDDYVFVPEFGAEKRKYVPDLLAKQFKQVLIRAGMDMGKDEARRVMYSIRHSSIMDRLVHGDTVDVNAIAQNARTSTEMVDRFYGSRLEGEMNIGKIQSDIRKISKNERLLGEGCDAKHGVDAAWERDLAVELEGLQRNEQSPKLQVIGNKVTIDGG